MEVISFDESGEFLTDVFYEVSIPLILSAEEIEEQRPDDVIASIGKGAERYVYSNIVPFHELEFACPFNAQHVTGSKLQRVLVDLFGGPSIGDFISETFWVIVTNDFASRLSETGLTGIVLHPLPINEDQSSAPMVELSWIEFPAKPCTRERIVHVPEPNLCPFCGQSPVVCPGCGKVASRCDKCKERIIVRRRDLRGPDDLRHFSSGIPKAGRIVEGHLWDGSDFLHDGSKMIASRRAIDWLLSVHASPFIARPRRVNIRDAKPEQRQRLEAAKHGQSPFDPL